VCKRESAERHLVADGDLTGLDHVGVDAETGVWHAGSERVDGVQASDRAQYVVVRVKQRVAPHQAEFDEVKQQAVDDMKTTFFTPHATAVSKT